MRLSDLRVRVILFLILSVSIGVIIRQTSFIFSYNIHNNYVEEVLEDVRGNEGYISDHIPDVLVVYDEENRSYKENLIDFLSQLKMDYDVLEASQYLNSSIDYPMVFLAVENFESVGNSNALFDYAEQGGHLFFMRGVALTPGFFEHYQKLGITEFTNYIEVESIYLNRGFLPDFKQRKYTGDFFWNSTLIVQLLREVPVYMKADDDVPIMWQRKYGTGEIIYFNGSMLFDRGHQIVLLEYLIQNIDPFIYPIVNAKLVTIGEFPAPLYQGEDESIYQEFSRDNGDFYREVWWPDILSLGKRYELEYATAALSEYVSDETQVVMNKEDYIYFAREILNQSGELGYQQLSFIQEGGLHQEFLPYYQYNQFVPVGGVLSEEELAYIDEHPLEIPIVTGRYRTGNPDVYQQSFRERASKVIEIPVISTGYVLDDMNLWMMNSGIKIQGIYHHYLSGNVLGSSGWENSYEAYSKHQLWLKRSYPFLESMTVTEAADEVVRYYRQDFTLHKEEEKWIIRSSHYGQKYFYFYSDREILNVTGGSLEELPAGGYLLEMNSDICVLEWSKL